MISVKWDDHGLTQRLQELSAKLEKPAALTKVLGREAHNRLRKHFLKRNETPNKLGGGRTYLWRQIAESVNQPHLAGENLAIISIAHPVYAQKLYGGDIRRKRVKALTIPLDAEAYGRSVQVFERETGQKLFPVNTASGRGFLASKDKAGTLHFRYLLRTSVHQEPEPDAFPDKDEFKAGLVERAEKYVARLTKGQSEND